MSEPTGTRPYVHPTLGEEVEAIGGHYVLIKEVRVPFRGREVLYVTGYAVLDRSCCGMAGCAWARVVGYVVQWKGGRDPRGAAVRQVKPVREGRARAALAQLIREAEAISQVEFL